MNCSDISFILDDRDTAMLDEESRNAVSAHLATCRDCASDWKLHARLAARKLPALPSGLVADCSALVDGAPAIALQRRKWNRIVVVGTCFAVLAAAAAMLTTLRPALPTAAEAAAVPAASIGPPAGKAVVDVLAEAQEVVPAEVQTPPAAAGASNTFSVRFSTSPPEALDALEILDFNAFRAAAIDELRRTPGLKLVLDGASSPEQPVDFEIALTTGRRDGQATVRLDAGKSGPDGVKVPFVIAFGGSCATCGDPARQGTAVARKLTGLMMVPAAAERSAFLKDLQDGSLPPEQRLEALRNLDGRGLSVIRTGGLRTDASGDSLRDPAIIRAVMDLASVTANPEHRAEIWKKMRSITSPELIAPLAHAAQLDSDATVRIEAVLTLVTDYAREPGARTALELISTGDPQALVRALARRGLSGEAAWNRYVVTTLEDRTLPDEQRLEAALFHLRNPQVSDRPLIQLLDDDTIKALTQVLPGAGSTGADRYGVNALLSQLESVRHPAVTSMLLASLERRDPRFDRRWVLEMLGARIEEPSVREVLEKISKNDPEEQSRRIATQALQDQYAIGNRKDVR